jgi:hypothetical protein
MSLNDSFRCQSVSAEVDVVEFKACDYLLR